MKVVPVTTVWPVLQAAIRLTGGMETIPLTVEPEMTVLTVMPMTITSLEVTAPTVLTVAPVMTPWLGETALIR